MSAEGGAMPSKALEVEVAEAMCRLSNGAHGEHDCHGAWQDIARAAIILVRRTPSPEVQRVLEAAASVVSPHCDLAHEMGRLRKAVEALAAREAGK